MSEQKQKTANDWHNHWKAEFKAARDALNNWHEQGDRIDKIIRDEREASQENLAKWNLFSANVETKAAMLYGRPPQVSVDRRHADQNDDVGRVAGEVMSRMLNTDIERKSDGCKSAYGYALRDRLLSGWGLVRARYVVEWEEVAETAPILDEATGQELAPAVPASKRKSFEDVETDYVHWKDQLWQPSRFFHEMGWWAHKSQMTRDALVRRFGQEKGQAVPLKAANPALDEAGKKTETQWDRADVWEIWDKDRELVHWYVEDYGVLETKEDPYELDGFWPFPAPMVANLTNSKLVPRPDFVIAQDLYDEVNRVTTRIKLLVEKIRVTGARDADSPELDAMLTEAGDGKLFPSTNWAALLAKGGIQGSVQFLPIENIASVVMQLRDYRRELVDIISQVTGMSDLMRGEATQAGASATEQRIKARVGSVRMQAMQDDFARFASEHQHIRAQLVAKFFEPQTIIERCNCEFTTDQELVPKALELIKSPKFSQYRIEVKPEAVSLTDFSALKAERMDALGGLSGFFQMAAPIVQQMPGAMPFLLQIGQWAISGMRGSSPLESAFDKAIQQVQAMEAQKAAAGPQAAPPDPKLLQIQAKAQADMALRDKDLQNDLARSQMKVQESAQIEANQRVENVREAAQRQQVANMLKPPAPLKGGPPR